MSVNIGINIQRSPNRINQNLREAGALGKYPKLLLDFKDEYYLANGGSKTFENAVTHARAGNATMTDGYGPELVTNGGFDSDSDWTLGTGWSIQNNRAYHASGANSNITQTIAVEAGKAYILEFYLSEGSSSNLWFIVDGAVTSVDSPTTRGNRSFVFTHDTTETIAVGVRAGSTNVAAIDRVSVREMPVLKWGPHNLLQYSQQVNLSPWVATSAGVSSSPARTADAGTAPDGTQTADRVQFDLNGGTTTTDQSRLRQTVSGDNVTFAVWLKSYDGSSTYNMQLAYTSGGGEEIVVTGDWQLFEMSQAASTSRVEIKLRGNQTPTHSDTADVLVWGAHLYRSDLGGMVDNPDRGDSYVPTTSAAVFLPRVGHHVFNSNAWVNEGVLAESESRTNLITDSFDFSAWANVGTTVTSDDAVSPAGTESADAILETTATSEHYRQKSVLSLTGTYTFSVYLKAAGSTQYVILGERSTTGAQASFDLTNGAVENTSLATATIQNIGNGWYRCSLTPFSSLSNQTFGSRIQLDNNGVIDANSYAGNASNGVYAYGAQLEEGSTPSSLIPTSGSTVSRAAETFTIPSANLPWPTPQYIGSELVTNGDFSNGETGFTEGGDGSGSDSSI